MHMWKVSAEWSLAPCSCSVQCERTQGTGRKGNCFRIVVLSEKRYYICVMHTQCSGYNVERMQCSGTAQRHGAVQSCCYRQLIPSGAVVCVLTGRVRFWPVPAVDCWFEGLHLPRRVLSSWLSRPPVRTKSHPAAGDLCLLYSAEYADCRSQVLPHTLPAELGTSTVLSAYTRGQSVLQLKGIPRFPVQLAVVHACWGEDACMMFMHQSLQKTQVLPSCEPAVLATLALSQHVKLSSYLYNVAVNMWRCSARHLERGKRC